MKSIDFTALIQAVITLISTVITIYILPKVKAYLAAKLTNEQRENLKQWVKVAVAAAEQIYKGSGLGTEKYRYVVDFLKEKGIYVNSDEVVTLIESEVYKLSQEYKKITPHPGESAEVLNEYCGDGNGLSEDSNSPVTDVESESESEDEGSEPDTSEAESEDNLFLQRNTCE